ncbi:flippase-like domain-containing protein [Halostella sp. JP-L12]|uniref:flippase-like domain-containing protein n=1 Tax=Halostella TaxID=1843185 RepID=UPI000EF838D7|nr:MULTISPECIES: flippase-like domain-containing protein [Halostella]NHN47499.1 flippase-like domain-containing protein [Halostella sp. JP-L12]
MSRRAVEVSVVLPAYNEEATLRDTVETTLESLAAFLPAGAFEVIVAEDGCDDRTPAIADELAAADERVRHFHSDERLGRGGALERAFEAANGETLVYFDTDLATDMRHLEELVESVRSDEYDVATGSRWIDGREADRPARRGVPSRGYNSLVRLFLRSDLQDHQCGFKAFDREALFTLLDDVEDDHWFWDTEVLVRAQRAGYRVREFPVDWTPKGDTKVDLVRDVFGMGSQILRTWWQVGVSPRIDRRVTLTAGTLLTFVAVALMTQYLDPATVLEHMAAADRGLVALSALVYLLSWPLRGARYRDILAELGYEERVGFLTGAVFISQTGNLVFPARAGDAVRAYVVKARRSIPYPTGFASLAVERVFDLLTITALAGTVLLGLVATGEAGALQSAVLGTDRDSGRVAVAVAAGVGAAAIAAVAAIVATARSDRNLVREGVTRLSSDSYAEYVAGVVEQFAGDVQTVASDGRAFARVGASSLLIWGLDVVTAILVLVAFDGVALPLPTLLAVGFFAVSVGNLAKVLPLSPGGIGLYEGAFSVLVVGLTPVGWGVALGAAIVDHAVKNAVTILGGVASMLLLNVSLTTAVEESADARDQDRSVTDD